MGSSIGLAVLVDVCASPVVQDVAQKAVPDNAAFAVLWHIITIGAAAAILLVILRKWFGW